MSLLACWQVPQAVQRRAAAVRVQPGGRRQAAGSDECARAVRRGVRSRGGTSYRTTPARPAPGHAGGRVIRAASSRTCVCSGPSLCVGEDIVKLFF